MSYVNGWAALNLQMPQRVPRTEYSFEMHWELIKEVTAIEVDKSSSVQARSEAQRAL